MSLFFSIVIPTYNRAAFLPRIIQSIQGQTFQNYEAIFVDDGSTDNSKDIISSFSASDKRIKYLYQQNKERGAARNTGIQAAKADYIVLVDSDDELHSQYLNYLHDAISSHPQVDFFACHFRFKDGDRIYNSPIENEKQDLLNYTFFL